MNITGSHTRLYKALQGLKLDRKEQRFVIWHCGTPCQNSVLIHPWQHCQDCRRVAAWQCSTLNAAMSPSIRGFVSELCQEKTGRKEGGWRWGGGGWEAATVTERDEGKQECWKKSVRNIKKTDINGDERPQRNGDNLKNGPEVFFKTKKVEKESTNSHLNETNHSEGSAFQR